MLAPTTLVASSVGAAHSTDVVSSEADEAPSTFSQYVVPCVDVCDCCAVAGGVRASAVGAIRAGIVGEQRGGGSGTAGGPLLMF